MAHESLRTTRIGMRASSGPNRPLAAKAVKKPSRRSGRIFGAMQPPT